MCLAQCLDGDFQCSVWCGEVVLMLVLGLPRGRPFKASARWCSAPMRARFEKGLPTY